MLSSMGTSGVSSNPFSLCRAGRPCGADHAAALQAVPKLLLGPHAWGNLTAPHALTEATRFLSQELTVYIKPLTFPPCICQRCHQHRTIWDNWGLGVRTDHGMLAMQVSREMSADIYSRLQSIDAIDTEGYCQWKKCDVPHSCW